MLVLKIVGVIVFLLFIYFLMEVSNSYTYKKYSYEFFSETNIGIYMVIYGGLFFGRKWYLNSDDPLNGILIMAIALTIFIFVLIKNIKRTSFLFGFFFSFIQAILYIPISMVGFLFLFGAMAYFSQARPVYKID